MKNQHGHINMKYYLILLSIILTSCAWFEKHEPSATKNTFEDIKARALTYQSLIKDPYEIADRCDGLTFLGLWDSSVEADKRIDLYKHEYPEGSWHRDIKPCYEVGDSRSEISTESFLGAMRGLWIRKDLKGIKRTLAYAEENNFVMADGPKDYTFLLHLMPLLYKMEGQLEKTLVAMGYSEDEWPNPWDKLKGYHGNVIANYIDIKAKVYGYVNAWEIKTLEKMVETVPSNPIYHALWNCYRENGGDQQTAIDILSGPEFPMETLPEEHLELFDYGKAPAPILYLWAVNIIETCGKDD